MKFNRDKFFTGVKERLDSTLTQEQVDGYNSLLDGFESYPQWTDIRHIAYAFATTFHETAQSMQPVEECYYLGAKAKAAQKRLRYYPYFGRGYVQLTWKSNYERAGKALGVDLINHPELALDPGNAFAVMTHGMHEAWFTKYKLTSFINRTECDYLNARKIINGLDKAGLIEGYARSFEKILKASVGGIQVPPIPFAESLERSSAGEASGELTTQPAVVEQTVSEPAAGAPDVITTTTQTLPGTGPKDEAVQVTTGATSSHVLFGTGTVTAIGTAIYGFITSNQNTIVVAIICATVLAVAIIFRKAILDVLRMQMAGDPTKYNVR